jgi:hypothetical protein
MTDTPIIPYQFDVAPTPARVAARMAAAKWMADHGNGIEGWEILGLETILVTGEVPPT